MTPAAAVDAGGDPVEVAGRANLVKLTVTNAAIDIALEAVRLVGNPGLLRANPLERHLRNALHGRVHTPQDDTILQGLGRRGLDDATRSLDEHTGDPMTLTHNPTTFDDAGEVELIGWAAPQESSEIMAPRGPIFDADVLAHTAQVHEEAGFDRVLIGYFTNAPDGFLVGAHVGRVDRAPRPPARPPPRASSPRRSRPASWPRSTS